MVILKVFFRILIILGFTYDNWALRALAKILANRRYRRAFGHGFDLTNPKGYNEIINYEKLMTDTSHWVELADKYKVREYVKAKGLEHILVKLYGVWDAASDVDFSQLPNSFVLKSNNGSATVILVKDKSKLNICKIRCKLNVWLKMKFGYRAVEPHYLKIKPLIIAEELLYNKDDISQQNSLIDYKWFCFNGNVTYVETISNRGSGTNKSIYDTQWVCHSQFINKNRAIPVEVARPKCLEQMIEICETLSKGFAQVRVDLYEVNGQVYFGELTFTTSGGYSRVRTPEFDLLLGDLYRKYNSLS